MEKVARYLSVLMMALALAACGDDDGSGAGGNTATEDPTVGGGTVEPTLALSSFTVQGSYGTTDGVVPITPSVDGGAFTVEWAVDGFDPTAGSYDLLGYNFYVAELVLSEDEVQDDGDVTLFWQSCGNPDYPCTATGTQTCTFRSDISFRCDVQREPDGLLFITYSFEPEMAAFFADGLPKSGYLVMTTCNWVNIQCTSKAVAVELQ